MAKFNNRAGSGDKGRSGRSRDERSGRKGSEKENDDKKKKDYKAKRSFSKNKVFREIKETRDEKPRRSFGSDERKPFKRDFDKKPDREKSASDSEFGNSDREGRKPFKKDFDKKERSDARPKRDFSEDKERRSFREDRPERRSDSEDRPRKSFRDETAEDRPRRDFKRDDDRQSRDERPKREDRDDRPRKSFRDENSEEKPRRSRESDDARPLKKAYNNEDKFSGFKRATSGFPSKPSSEGKDKKRRVTKPRKSEQEGDARRVKYDDFEEGRAFSKKAERSEEKSIRKPAKPSKPQNEDGLIRLNKYLSNAGIASRRDADNLIQSGTVKVNGVVVDQLGYKIKPGDKVTYGDAAVKSERKVYLLLNKPKDYITTVEDPRERKTVMELIAGACRERVYPVGRLDRNTTGLLLFTNDGDLTTKLTHPKFGVKKIYHVSLNKGLKPEDFKAIIEGVELEDGIVKADDLAFVGEGKKEVGIEIHSGRNRIVRRLFEHLGYDVIKLDRVVFAGLTKKDLPRGKHRFLTAKEISFLQMLG